MYEKFFGLRARPFGITPSAELFFHSSAHSRTLACLRESVLGGKPVVALIGNIGAGKTTVLQALLRGLPGTFVSAIVASTQLDEIELTRSMLLAFGAAATGESTEALHAALREHLERLRSRHQRGLLVIDEAQNLAAATLRYVMRLAELAMQTEPDLLQVILSGQPGLEPLLGEAVGERHGRDLPLCRLKPMNTMDTGSYVRHRLRLVGTGGGPTFSEDALDLVRLATGGLPRVVNRLCDRVLVSAYLDGARDIDSIRVARAAGELREELGDVDAPVPTVAHHDAIPTDQPTDAAAAPQFTVAPPARNDPLPVADAPAAIAPQAEARPPAPSPEESAVSPTPVAGRKRAWRPWPAVAAGGLLALSVAWIAYESPSRRDAKESGGVVASDVASPTIKIGATAARQQESTSSAAGGAARDRESSGASASNELREPIRPNAQSLDARAALGLAPEPESLTALPAAAVVAAPRAASPASAPVVASCTAATRALGLCP